MNVCGEDRAWSLIDLRAFRAGLIRHVQNG